VQSSLGECAEAQPATIARPARFVIKLVIRPSAGKRRPGSAHGAQFHTFSHSDDRRQNMDIRFRAPFFDYFFESPVNK
jgi:hypothetical protein